MHGVMSDWGEIRQLQAELERVQTTSTAFKLSEANCVEIVKRLTEMKLLNVLFTVDGKEYVHPDHLEREILNELEANKGRIEVTELQQTLNVDLHHIQRGVDNLVKHNENLERIPGELITSLYKESLCTEINEMLLQSGFVSLADLSTTFILSLDFVTKCVENALNTIITGQLDKSGSGLLYTECYVSRHRARLRGLFSAVTHPIPISPLVTEGKYHERLFHSVLHELISSGELAGSLHGRGARTIFIPAVYSQMQNQWVDNFLSDNGYLEYDTLVRLGIDTPQSYIQMRYRERDDLVMLRTCCIGSSILSEISANVEDTVISQLKWIDIMTILPSPCIDEDGELFLQKVYGKEDHFFIAGAILAHQDFIRTCLDLFKVLIEEKAKTAAATSGLFLRQVSLEGGGGGEGKRGGKQKKGKMKREREEATSDGWDIIFMSKKEIEQTLLDKIDDLPEEFATTLSHSLYKPLQERLEAAARLMFVERAEGEAGSQRRKHSELQGGIQEMWNRVRLFDKGIGLFEDDLKVQLSKYLLRTLCTDMTNQVIKYIAEGYNIAVPENMEMFNKERPKVINKFSDAVKRLSLAVNSSLSIKEVGGFIVSFEDLCDTESCGIMLRKLDKKKEKQLIFSHQEELKSSLEKEQDPAMALHLVTVLLFQKHTSCLLHTPGRLIPQIIAFLRRYMELVEFTKLDTYQSLVVLELKTANQTASNETEGDSLEIDSKLFEDDEVVCDVAKDSKGEAENELLKKSKKGGDVREQLELKLDELKDLILKQKKVSN